MCLQQCHWEIRKRRLCPCELFEQWMIAKKINATLASTMEARICSNGNSKNIWLLALANCTTDLLVIILMVHDLANAKKLSADFVLYLA